MTICVPKRPFEIMGKVILYTMLFSWMPIFAYGIYQIIMGNYPNALLGIFGILPFVFWFWWFDDYNNEHHLIEWCDKQNLREVKE